MGQKPTTGTNIMKLNNKTITALKPRINQNGKLGTYRVGDGRNLFLQVTATGAKSWLYIYRAANGKQRELGLGSFTGAGAAVAVTLERARLAADRARAQLAAGLDPIEEKIASKLAASSLFSVVLDDFLAKVPALKGWKPEADGSYAQEKAWRSSFSEHAALLMGKPVDAIDRALVLRVLQPIWGRKVGEDLRNRIEQVLDYAAGHGHRKGLDNAASWKGNLQSALIAKPSKKNTDSHEALPAEEIPALMTKLVSGGMAAKGLAFLILTAARTDEARLARWSEIDLKHVDGPRWTVPAERMKAGVEHIVPLSTAAITLLASLPRCFSKDNDFLFIGQKTGASIGATAFSDKLCDPAKKGGLGFKGKATVHGMRSTFSDWVGDKTSFAKEDREFCLAHGLDAVEGAYRRATAVEKRRAIMQAWANHCEGKTGQNVVSLAA